MNAMRPTSRVISATVITFYTLFTPLAAADNPREAPQGESQSAAPSGLGGATMSPDLIGVNPANGAPSVTIPFELLRARGAAQPQLALHYLPFSDGEAGHHWTLGMGAIERKPLWGLPRYDNDPSTTNGFSLSQTDRLSFAGQDLVPLCQVTGGTCSSVPNEQFSSSLEGWYYFRPLIDELFRRFFWSPDLNTWRIEERSGSVLEFGVPRNESNYDGAVDREAGRAPFRWNLVRQWDPQGEAANPIEYRWTHLGALGRGYLTDIFDTPPARELAIDFSRWAHHTHLTYGPHPYTVLNSGNPMFARHSHRLQRVDITSENFDAQGPRFQVRSYDLDYFDTTLQPRYFNSSFLTSVRVRARDPKLCLEAPDFSLPSCGGRSLPAMQLEYDGLSEKDQCLAPFSHPILFDDSYFPGTPVTIPTMYTTGGASQMVLVDGNQDGVADFYFPGIGTHKPPIALVNRVARNNRFEYSDSSVTALFGPCCPQIQVTSDQVLHDATLIGDWGYEGAQLLFPVLDFSYPNNSWAWALLSKQIPATPADSFTWTGVSYQKSSIFQKDVQHIGPQFVDLNRDGLVDWLTPPKGNFGTLDVKFTSRDGTGHVNPFSVDVPGLVTGSAASSNDYVDMDGDGLVDAIQRPKVQGGTLTISYIPGDGRGGFPFQSFRSFGPIAVAGDTSNQPPYAFHDVDGDGLADLVQVVTINNEAFASITLNSDGQQWGNIYLLSLSSAGLGAQITKVMFGDIDGDGVDDIVATDGQHSAWVGMMRCSGRDFRLRSFANGRGASSIITYDHAVHLQQTGRMKGSAPVAFDVVAGVDTSAGDVNWSKAYFYDEPVYDYWRRQLRGFRKVRERSAMNELFAASTNAGPFAKGHTQVETTYKLEGCSQTDSGSSCNPDAAATRFDALRWVPPLPSTIDVFGDLNRDASLTDDPHKPGFSKYLSTTHHEYQLEPFAVGADLRHVWTLVPMRTDTYLYDTATPSADSTTTLTDLLCGGDATGRNALPCVTSNVTLHAPEANRAHLRQDQAFDGFGNLVEHKAFGRIHDDDTPIDQAIDVTYKPGLVAGSDWTWRPLSSVTAPFTVTPPAVDYSRVYAFAWDPRGNLTHVYGILEGTLSLDRHHESGKSVALAPGDGSTNGIVLLNQLDHDVWGNIVQATGPNGGCSVFGYDDAYQQLQTATTLYTDGCGVGGLTWSRRYQREFGVPTVVKAPGPQLTTIDYDDIGRQQHVYEPDPATPGVTVSVPITFEYDDNNGTYHFVHVTAAPTLEHPKGTSESYHFFDGFERNTFTISRADVTAGDIAPWILSGLHVYTDDQEFLEYEPSPYVSTPLVLNLTTAVHAPFRRTVGDAFWRATEVHDLDNGEACLGQPTSGQCPSILRTTYHALSVDRQAERSTDVLTIRKDGHGRIIGQARRNGSDNLTLAYGYTVAGEVSSVTQGHSANPADGITRWLQYDSFGRLVSNIEPNSGVNLLQPGQAVWRYAYNDSGRLVGTSDARGCGENLSYDSAGRLIARDYSPCKNSQPDYTLPSSGLIDGTEARYIYDSVGRLVAAADVGAVDAMRYDDRGRTTRIIRRVAKPGEPNEFLATRYSAHSFQLDMAYDEANRLTEQSTGADIPELLNNGISSVSMRYSERGLLSALYSSYDTSEALVDNFKFDVDGLPLQAQFHDRALTQQTMDYDTRRRLKSNSVTRGPSSSWATPSGTYTPPQDLSTLQTSLVNTLYGYDDDGNLGSVTDQRVTNPSLAAEWPSGSKPVSKTMAYDDVRRLVESDYTYPGQGVDIQTSPSAADDATGRPLPMQPSPNRVVWQKYNYDWRDNFTLSDDDQHLVFDRSLGSSPTYSSDHPHQFVSNADNTIQAEYDESGNLVNLVVRRPGATCTSSGKCMQRFVYDWDEVGNLSRARRWDYSILPTTDPPYPDVPTDSPAIDLSFVYHQGARIMKASADPSTPTYTINVFSSLRLDNATWDGGTNDYERDAMTESAYLAGVAHAIYQTQATPTLTGACDTCGHLHIFYQLRDHLGSQAVEFDRETGEVVESTTYDGYGAIDSDYRAGRWASYREPQHYQGHDDDIEMGLVYFGARYYSPYLNQWISPDPLSIHGLASTFNPYAFATQARDPYGLDCGDMSGCPGPTLDFGDFGGGGGGGGTAGGGGGGGGGGGWGGSGWTPAYNVPATIGATAASGWNPYGTTSPRADEQVLWDVSNFFGMQPTTENLFALSTLVPRWLQSSISPLFLSNGECQEGGACELGVLVAGMIATNTNVHMGTVIAMWGRSFAAPVLAAQAALGDVENMDPAARATFEHGTFLFRNPDGTYSYTPLLTGYIIDGREYVGMPTNPATVIPSWAVGVGAAHAHTFSGVAWASLQDVVGTAAYFSWKFGAFVGYISGPNGELIQYNTFGVMAIWQDMFSPVPRGYDIP